jgi:hypothetical protein
MPALTITIRPDLIPASSWGASLANLLTNRAWNEIRKPILAASGQRCRICSGAGDECHELWAYSSPPLSDTLGVQRLMGIVALCHRWHEIFHWGLANKRGRGDEVRRRLAEHNGWTSQQLAEYRSEQGAVWKARSQHYWALDLSFCMKKIPCK